LPNRKSISENNIIYNTNNNIQQSKTQFSCIVRVVAANSSAPAPKIKGKGKIYHEPIQLNHFQGVGACHECI
jgi:hypothetical protein